MNEIRERQLIKKSQKGNVDAFDELLRMHENNIYSICMRMLKNEHDANDAAQEICLKIWQQMPQFQGQAKFSTWAYRIATNQCLDMIRRNQIQRNKEKSMNYNAEQGEWNYDIADEKVNVAAQVEAMELQGGIKKSLETLKDEHKEIIVLKDLENYSYEEISKLLNVSMGTVKSRLYRARNQFKKALMKDTELFNSFVRQTNTRKGL